MKLLILQHARVEHPGIFGDFFREDGFAMHTVELDEGDKLPSLDPFDVMVVMGGPQDVWQEDEYPWFREEKEAIRKFVVDMQRPYLGICLGHQLLADALGGSVTPARTSEVGVLPVSKTKAGEDDPVTGKLPDPLNVLQWHGAEVVEIPPGGTVLVSSDVCPIQAFRFGDLAYGMQFHVEVTSETVQNWAVIPEYARALADALGPEGLPTFDGQVSAELPRFNQNARTLYDGLKAVWAKA
jgi:GMP synthase-like glutamine amidotransferase